MYCLPICSLEFVNPTREKRDMLQPVKKKNNMQQFAVSAGCVCVCVCGVCGAPHCAARVQTLGADNLSGNECNVAVG